MDSHKESPAERARRILREDAFRIELNHLQTALCFKSMALSVAKKNTQLRALKDFIDSANKLSVLFEDYSKTSLNLEFAIWFYMKLLKYLRLTQGNQICTMRCLNALLWTRNKAFRLCHEFGNVLPFLEPLPLSSVALTRKSPINSSQKK